MAHKSFEGDLQTLENGINELISKGIIIKEIKFHSSSDLKNNILKIAIFYDELSDQQKRADYLNPNSCVPSSASWSTGGGGGGSGASPNPSSHTH